MDTDKEQLPRIVIIGSGFGGLTAAQSLSKAKVRVTVLDRTNHHLFQPLLYQVATGALSPANIAAPIRSVLRNSRNTEVFLADVLSVDVANKKVITADIAHPYDYLIVATGARHSYFGKPEWEQFAPGLKTLADAIEVRRRIFTAFELAEKALDEEERKQALTFVIVGGGPTGVEMAGAIAEIARFTLAKDFRHIDPTSARIILIEGSDRILGGFTPDLSESAKKQLESLGVEVRCDHRVNCVDDEGVIMDATRIPSRTVVWAAGNTASPLLKSLGCPLDRMGRALILDDLTIPDHPEIQVIGDAANFSHQTGNPLPGLCPVAMQQGEHAAQNIRHQMRGGKAKLFFYTDKGAMATIGRNKAVADIHVAKFSGFVAWLAWLFIHLMFLIGFKNRFVALVEWAWYYISFNRGARLISEKIADRRNLHSPSSGSVPNK